MTWLHLFSHTADDTATLIQSLQTIHAASTYKAKGGNKDSTATVLGSEGKKCTISKVCLRKALCNMHAGCF